jgi:hypothetical protein
MGPVAVDENEDVTGGRHGRATLPSPLMPARSRIPALVAGVALAQSGADDSRYQDPFGSSTRSAQGEAEGARGAVGATTEAGLAAVAGPTDAGSHRPGRRGARH